MNPSASDAALSIAEAERVAASVRSGATRFTAWLVGVAAATPLYFAGLLVADDETAGIVITTVSFGIVLLAVSLSLLPGSGVAVRGFSVRWGIGVSLWGGLFGASVGIGLALFPGTIWFWAIASVLTVAPLVVAARAEFRA